jgi:hypothetical protein
VVVIEVIVPRDVHVVPFGEVSITQLQAAVLVLLRYQKENTPGDVIIGVRIQSPEPLNPIDLPPVRTGLVNVITEFWDQVPPCVGSVVVPKLS